MLLNPNVLAAKRTVHEHAGSLRDQKPVELRANEVPGGALRRAYRARPRPSQFSFSHPDFERHSVQIWVETSKGIPYDEADD